MLDVLLNRLLAGNWLPHPRVVNIEPVSNLCQLKCPLCPTGIDLLNYPPQIMPLETFKAILDKLPFISVAEIYRSGEPFLNQELPAMIRYARNRGITVVISSHFSFTRPDAFFEEIVLSGLDKLYISLDGTSQESYSHYRVGGCYEQVMTNIRKLLETRRSLRTGTPEVIWQFLVNRYNENDIPDAHRIARELGVKLEIRPIDLDDELPDIVLPETIEERMTRWLPRNEKYIARRYLGERSLPLFPGSCRDLFTRMIVTVDGSVMPCCMVWNRDNAFGNLLTEPFDRIWYGPKYRDARMYFLQDGYPPRIPSICHRCDNFSPPISLKNKLGLALAVYRKNISLYALKLRAKMSS